MNGIPLSDGMAHIPNHIMHYFSIHTPSGEHVGFFIMLPDDETEQPPQSGRFMVKLQSEAPPQEAAARALAPYQSTDTPFYWAVDKDYVTLFDRQENIGRIRNEYLSIGGQTLLLNDLTGTL